MPSHKPHMPHHRPHIRKNLPAYSWKTDSATLRKDILATIAEFCGTFLFLLLGLGGIQAAATSNQASLAAAAASQGQSASSGNSAAQAINTVASVEQLLFIATAMGLALLISAFAFYRVSGSAFNPAVSLALAMVGILSPVRFIMYFVAEVIAGIAASAVLNGLTPGALVVATAPGAGTNLAQAVFIEMFITSALVFVVFLLAAEKSSATPLAPIGIGLTLFACHLFAVIFTGAGMNPARSFGPEVVSGFASTQWVYWVGPFLGSILATALYVFLLSIKYWELNPTQDATDKKLSPANPLEVIAPQILPSAPDQTAALSRQASVISRQASVIDHQASALEHHTEKAADNAAEMA